MKYNVPSSMAGYLSAGVAATLFGIQVPLVALLSKAGVFPVTMVALRAFLIMGALFVFARLSGFKLGLERPILRSNFFYGLATAFVSLCYLSSVAYIPVSLATVVFYTFPLWILLVSPLVFKEKYSVFLFPLFVLIFIGLVLAVGGGVEGPAFSFSIHSIKTFVFSSFGHGLLLAFFASFGVAFQFIFGSTFAGKIHPVRNIFWIHFWVFIPSLLTFLIVDSHASFDLDGRVLILWVLSTLVYLVGIIFQFTAFARSKATLVGVIFCIEPVVSIAVAWALLGESLSVSQYAGSLLILLGISFAIILERRRAPPTLT